jgi:MMP 1-O-methyltransferase
LALPYAVRQAADYYPTLPPEIIRARIGYATYVSVKRKYLYCEVPKAACTSLKALIHAVERLPRIEPLRGSLRETRRDMFVHDRGQFRMPSLLDFDDAQQEHILTSPEFFRFTVVRNPYTRLESAWKDKVRNCAPNYEYLYHRLKGELPCGKDPESIITFAEFVDAIEPANLLSCDHHWRLQTATTFHPALSFTHIGRLEAMEDTLERFLAHVDRLDLKHAQSMNASESSSSFTEAIANKVWTLYRTDFTTFGYDAASWPGAQLSWPGAALVPFSHSRPAVVSESKYLEEVLERNVVIGKLYDIRDELERRSSVKKPDFLHRYARLSFDELFDRYIAQIDGWLSKEEALVCYELAKSVTDGCIVEVGSYRGRSTAALAFGSLAGARRPVYAIEPHEPFVGPLGGQYEPLDRGHFMQKLVELGLFHLVRLVNLDSQFLGARWPQPVGLLWLDADHRYEAVARDIGHWRAFLREGAAVVLREATSSDSGPARAAAELIAGGDFEPVASVGKIQHLRRCRSTSYRAVATVEELG